MLILVSDVCVPPLLHTKTRIKAVWYLKHLTAFDKIKCLFTIMYHESTVITIWQKASHFFHLFCLSVMLFLMKHLTHFINAEVECVRLFWHHTNTLKPLVEPPYVKWRNITLKFSYSTYIIKPSLLLLLRPSLYYRRWDAGFMQQTGQTSFKPLTQHTDSHRLCCVNRWSVSAFEFRMEK